MISRGERVAGAGGLADDDVDGAGEVALGEAARLTEVSRDGSPAKSVAAKPRSSGRSTIGIAGDEPAIGVEDGVEHAVVGGERQELEGRGRDVDEDARRRGHAPTPAICVGGADQQPVVGLLRRRRP